MASPASTSLDGACTRAARHIAHYFRIASMAAQPTMATPVAAGVGPPPPAAAWPCRQPRHLRTLSPPPALRQTLCWVSPPGEDLRCSRCMGDETLCWTVCAALASWPHPSWSTPGGRNPVLPLPAAVILGGGAGTRLYPLTKNRAKPAVPIGGAYRLVRRAASGEWRGQHWAPTAGAQAAWVAWPCLQSLAQPGFCRQMRAWNQSQEMLSAYEGWPHAYA